MSDETVRLTYSDLAKARGITLAAARRMTLRHKWPKQVGNDGLSRVSVPTSALAHDVASTGNTPGNGTGDTRHAAASNGNGAATGNGTDDLTAAVQSLGDAVTSLTVQLVRERERANRADERAREAESRTRDAEGRV